jgi:type I restriction enzyme S subunit
MKTDMKKGWEMKRLDTVCTFINGKAYNKNELLISGKYPVLRVGNFFTNNHWYYSDLELPEDKYCVNGDLLYAWSASFGPKIWSGEKVIYHYHIWKVVPDEKLITKEFLYLLLDWDIEQIKKDQGTGTTMMHVGKGSMDARVVPIPPLPEQQRIVSILDVAFAAIAVAKTNAELNLKNAKELFESYLQGVFEKKGEGWEERTLGDVCEYDKTSNKRVDLPYVGLEDIQSNTGIFIGPFEPRSMKSLTFYFNNEHVLYGRLRPYLNKVLLPDFEGHCSTEIFPIKPKKNVLDRGFLFQWLIANETMKKINATWTGATLPRANMNTVLEFKINLPSYKEQQTIVQKLDALSAETKRLEAIYQQKLLDLEELKKSVLQNAFNGEL